MYGEGGSTLRRHDGGWNVNMTTDVGWWSYLQLCAVVTVPLEHLHFGCTVKLFGARRFLAKSETRHKYNWRLLIWTIITTLFISSLINMLLVRNIYVFISGNRCCIYFQIISQWLSDHWNTAIKGWSILKLCSDRTTAVVYVFYQQASRLEVGDQRWLRDCQRHLCHLDNPPLDHCPSSGSGSWHWSSGFM